MGFGGLQALWLRAARQLDGHAQATHIAHARHSRTGCLELWFGSPREERPLQRQKRCAGPRQGRGISVWERTGHPLIPPPPSALLGRLPHGCIGGCASTSARTRHAQRRGCWFSPIVIYRRRVGKDEACTWQVWWGHPPKVDPTACPFRTRLRACAPVPTSARRRAHMLLNVGAALAVQRQGGPSDCLFLCRTTAHRHCGGHAQGRSGAGGRGRGPARRHTWWKSSGFFWQWSSRRLTSCCRACCARSRDRGRCRMALYVASLKSRLDWYLRGEGICSNRGWQEAR